MPTVYFETFGCQMNVADSDKIRSLLSVRGYTPADHPDEADLIVVNTCSVREKAETRALGRLRELCNRNRKEKKGQTIWVCGCMAQRLGDTLHELVPGLCAIIGAQKIDTVEEEIERLLPGCAPAPDALFPESCAVSSFVPVMRGCDNFCAYCIVPYVRGREHSFPAATLEEEVRRLTGQGTVEVTLLGQNVNSYNDNGIDFPALLQRLHAVEGLRRIRFTTSHPKDCSERLIQTVAGLPKCCNHIHLPVQAGSSRVLSAMNRGYTRKEYLHLIDRIRAHIPDADITTDVMVGFPGETPDDFSDTLSLFEQVRYTDAFMFAYSPREGTAAAQIPDTVEPAEKKRRLQQIIELQTGITRERYEHAVGDTVAVLAENKKNEQWIGRTDGCKRVAFPCETAIAGTIFKVRIQRSSGKTLIGEVST